MNSFLLPPELIFLTFRLKFSPAFYSEFQFLSFSFSLDIQLNYKKMQTRKKSKKNSLFFLHDIYQELKEMSWEKIKYWNCLRICFILTLGFPHFHVICIFKGKRSEIFVNLWNFRWKLQLKSFRLLTNQWITR